MFVRVLGPVEICAGNRVLPVGPAQRCAVFGALVVDAGRFVPAETLIDRIWGELPPERARRTLHTHLSRIRRIIEQANTGSDGPVRLVRRAGGYALEVDAESVDFRRFTGLVRRARNTDRADSERIELLREALGLWRGDPLAGVCGPWAERLREAWRQHQLDAVLAWAEAELRLGNAGVVICRLTELSDRYPLSESLVAMLVSALSGAGHTAQALEVYLRMRARLVAELGVDPGTELQGVYHRLLHRSTPNPATRMRSVRR